MATAADFSTQDWFRQSSDPIFDGNYHDRDRDSSPITADVRQYIFGHSLINHTDVGESNDITNILIWLHELADDAGFSYAFSMQFGLGESHVQSLPNPVSQLEVLNVTKAWDSDAQTFAEANHNSVVFTPANFRQEFAADASSGFWDDITTETTEALFDWAEGEAPETNRFIIYENWGDMGPFTSANFTSTFPTAGELTNYWNYTQGAFHDWWVDYQDTMLADRADLDINMIPVGPILGLLLEGTLLSITPAALYEDNAPHGRPTLYFLAGLITYMGTYGIKAHADYVVPDTVDSIVLANYTTIVDEIWTELLNFNYPSGDSRVFPSGSL